MISLIFFILILAVLVLIHEFGHFIAAKINGVLVEEFGFGFPPRAWGKKIGETLYSINWLPIGGFVKVFGEEYHELDSQGKKIPHKDRAFVFKKPWQKAIIILAGVFMNLILAVGIYYILLSANNFHSQPLPLFGEFRFPFGTEQKRILVGGINPSSPAEKAGIHNGDIILGIKTPASPNFVTIDSGEQLIKLVNNSRDEAVVINLQNIRNDAEQTVTVKPQYNEKLKRSIIGINLVDTVVLTYQQPHQKLLAGFMHSFNLVDYNVTTIGQFVQTAFKEKSLEPVASTVSGPVGIFSIVDELVKSSGKKFVANLLDTIALLSLSLALMNVLPFPALDGGRLVFVVYEWITGKRVNHKIEQYINMAGIIILLSFALLITINDLIRIFR